MIKPIKPNLFYVVILQWIKKKVTPVIFENLMYTPVYYI